MRLLIGHSDELGHLLLGEAEHDPPLADAHAHIVIDVESATTPAGAAADDLARELVHEAWTPQARGRFVDPTRHRSDFAKIQPFFR